jgi:hypothetical protein
VPKLGEMHVSPLRQQTLPQAWLLGQQAKLTHVSPLAQQVPPTVWLRQAELLDAKPTPQVLPLGQQTPFAVQLWPDEQARHAKPPVPHSDAHWEVTWRQLPLLSQQPLGQVVGVQTTTQAPFWHT